MAIALAVVPPGLRHALDVAGGVHGKLFADATHYSHAFRDTFGVNPAPVFRKIERFDRLV